VFFSLPGCDTALRIKVTNVYDSPGHGWVKQQIREIIPYGEGPRFLVHDNDGIFGQFGYRKKQQAGKNYRCAFDVWLEKTMGIVRVDSIRPADLSKTSKAKNFLHGK